MAVSALTPVRCKRRGQRARAFITSKQKASDAEGFAAVDALVALTLIAMTLALTIVAAQGAQRNSLRALELRRADTLLKYLLLAKPHALGVQAGDTDRFAWTVTTAPSQIDAEPSNLAICTRTASVRAAASGRAYRMTTSESCPVARVAP
jgi:hypothetical protein